MNPVWRFKSLEWNENGTNVELTISGKQFAKLMDLCFEQADAFSFCAARWANAKDRRLENALKGFKRVKYTQTIGFAMALHIQT